MKNCLVIVNPYSGKENKEPILAYLEQQLKLRNYNVEFYYTKCVNDATLKTIETINTDLIISVGGDGTLNEVVSGMQKRTKVINLGFLPLGTTNDVGHMYGYTKNHKKNIDIMLDGNIKNVDTCFINDKSFLYVACIGNYMDAAYTTSHDFKKKFGRTAYIVETLKKTITPLKIINLEYTIDNVTYTGKFSFIFITNSISIGGVKNVLPDVLLDDNMFEVFMCNAKNKVDALKHFISFNKNKLKDNHLDGFRYYKTNNLKIKFLEHPNFSWCIDGEELKLDTLTYKFKVNQKIEMLIPNVNNEDLFKK